MTPLRPKDTTVHQILPFSSDAGLRRRFAVTAGNEPANVRWGLLLEELDTLAEQVAITHVRRVMPGARAVTAAIDDVVLRTPLDLDRDLHLRARLNYVGRTSMEVGIRVDHGRVSGPSLASCYFTMVGRSGTGEDATSVPVPPLAYADQMERFRYAAAVASRKAFLEGSTRSEQPPSPDEFRLLAELHGAQESPGFAGLRARDLQKSSWEFMYPQYENVPSKIFGGHLIRRSLELAVIHAQDVATHRPVVVAINRINFLQPVRIGDKLHFQSRVVYSGRTSFCVELDIRRVSQDNVTSSLSNTCTFTFVNVDRDMRPRPVPQVVPTTYAEDARYLAAFRRHRRYREQQVRRRLGVAVPE
jgi:acyl-coenzyme A thioesterase 9